MEVKKGRFGRRMPIGTAFFPFLLIQADKWGQSGTKLEKLIVDPTKYEPKTPISL
jgi:hypothetical protein